MTSAYLHRKLKSTLLLKCSNSTKPIKLDISVLPILTGYPSTVLIYERKLL